MREWRDNLNAVVEGEGPQPCKTMIVGEAPGKVEVMQGRPFVGKAGKLLDYALEELGIDRASVYITNVVKKLPLTSEEWIRPPTQEEVDAWRPAFGREIVACHPEYILALGRTALNWFKPRKGVKFGEHVQVYIPEAHIWRLVFAAWHPSYVRRQGGEQGPIEHGIYYRWLDQLKPWAEAIR